MAQANNSSINSSVYSRMAGSKLKCTNQLTAGSFPKTIFIAQFVYENGLVVNFDGERWSVVKDEDVAQ